MSKAVYFVLLVFFIITVSLAKCFPLPIPSNIDNKRSYAYDVNGIDHHDDASNKTSSEEEMGMLILDENQSNPWDTLVLSLRNGLPPTTTDRSRFAHFYKKKPGEPLSNIDPIVFPTVSDEFHTIVNREDGKVTDRSMPDEVTPENENPEIVGSAENDSSSSTSSESTEALSTTENDEIQMEDLQKWLWENLRLTSENNAQTTTKRSDGIPADIGTHSLYHGPKIKKGRGKINCPPGQRPNHFGECKCPITLKQTDYD